MEIKKIIEKARSVRGKYNPDDLALFPYNNIISDIKNLDILEGDLEDDDILGAIVYKEEEDKFNIYINTVKSAERQYFTVAHELGHYFLHEKELREEKILIDPESLLDGKRVFFNLSGEQLNELEIDADNFAMNLLAPEAVLVKVWNALKNPERCAKFFNIPLSLMSAKLEKMGLIGNSK